MADVRLDLPTLDRGSPLARGLVAWYPMRPAGGTTLYDLGPSRRLGGTLVDGPPWTPGEYGPALAFDAANFTRRVELPAGGTMPAGGWTWQVWIRAASYSTLRDHRGVFCTWGSYSFYLTVGAARVNVYTAAAAAWRQGATALTAGRWHLVGVSHDGATLRLWLDGREDASYTQAHNWTSATGYYVGRRGDSANSNAAFDGLVGGLSLHGRALAESEARALYDRGPLGLAAPSPSLSIFDLAAAAAGGGGGSTTTAGRSLSTPASTRTALGRTLVSPASTRAAAGRPLGLPASTRALAGRGLAAPSSTLGAVGRTLALPASTESTSPIVGRSLSLPASTLRAIGRTLVSPASTRITSGRSLSLPTSTRSALGRGLALPASTRALAGRTLDLPASTEGEAPATAGRSLSLPASTRALAGRSLSLPARTEATPAPVATLREAIRAALLASLGADAAVHYGAIPQGTNGPATAYAITSDVKERRLSGATKVSRARVEVEHQSSDPADLESMRVATEEALLDRRGPWHGVHLLWSHQEDDADRDERPDDASDRLIYILTKEYLLRYEPAREGP